jgi:hypothetical protein
MRLTTRKAIKALEGEGTRSARAGDESDRWEAWHEQKLDADRHHYALTDPCEVDSLRDEIRDGWAPAERRRRAPWQREGEQLEFEPLPTGDLPAEFFT